MRISAIFLLFTMAVCGSLSGCATVGYADKWNARIGHYTYDDVLKKHGPPDSKEGLPGGGFVAKWSVEHADIDEFGGSAWKEVMVLTFDSSGVLQGWSHTRG